MTEPVPQQKMVLEALERLLAWPEISRSHQLGKFLDYIVRRTLDGDGQAIKAYSIAVDVFGRSEDFDPQADPIVRVQARRLRSLLDGYYAGPGIADKLQIKLPVGRYVPDFVTAAEPVVLPPLPPAIVVPPPQPPVNVGLPRTWFVLAVVALGTAMMAYGTSKWSPDPARPVMHSLQQPSVSIVEFQNLAAGVSPAPQSGGLALELVTDLDQFGDVSVRYGGVGDSALADEPPSDFVLTGIVRPADGLVQYSAILTDSRTATVVWNHTLAVEPDVAASLRVLDPVSQSIALALGSPRGPLHTRVREQIMSDAEIVGPPDLYVCRAMFSLYRDTNNPALALRSQSCFESLAEPEKGSAVALAAMASLSFDLAQTIRRAEPGQFGGAFEMLTQAIALNPLSSFVWEQQARMHEALGSLVQARSEYNAAILLNPANVDALAAHARLLAWSGDLAEAEKLAIDAAERSPTPPDWYFGVPAMVALRDGNYIQAALNAERYVQADKEFGCILAILAGLGSGDNALVNRYLPQALELATFRSKGIISRLRERIRDEEFLSRISTALLDAGVPATSLTEPF